MPYTPPSQQSPASSKPTSPAISRSASYHEDGPRSPSIGRPTPPRSNSASYLHRERRSPSITKSDGAPPTPLEAPDSHIQAADFAHNGSVRQSPPPVNNLLIPTGAMLSPPDSSENSDGSDGDESANHGHERGRELDSRNWDELHAAVRLIDQRREGSPERSGRPSESKTKSEPVSQISSPTALTKEARKISHSRSSTETAIVIPRQQFESPTQGSDDSEDENGPLTKPQLVRKKSGELVKPALRPSSRRRYSSMPGTPTYGKSVHFNDNDNQTRHFLQVDKPIAVSAGTSPVETYEDETEFPFDADLPPEREIKLNNFPADTFDRRTKPIRVERIFLSADRQMLIGVCAVQNISFHKLVVARFTLDYWKTTSEVVAEYNNDPRNPNTDGCDRFNFHIKLSDQANVDNKTLLLCVRYNVGGQEFWDNNENTNYQIDFNNTAKTAQKPKKSVALPGLGARPLSALPRSKHNSPTAPRAQRDSLDDDFAARFDNGSAYTVGSPVQLLGESPTSVKLKPRTKRGSIFPTADSTQPTNGLGGRYDFGASLSAALTSAQDKLGRQSGLMSPSQRPNSGNYFGPIERKEKPTKADERPDAITTDRPAMGSDQYKDLIEKFCHFTSNPGKPSTASPRPQTSVVKTQPSEPAPGADGTVEEDAPNSPDSSSSSEASSPAYDGKTDPLTSSAPSPWSRTSSPGPVTGGALGGRSSPISFGYPYHHNSRDGYLSDSQTPTAIQG